MNVYDFDGTIYKGDSSLDFFRFELSKNGRLFKYIPKILNAYIKFLNKQISKTEFKEAVFEYLKDVSEIDKDVFEFWSTYKNKIYPWYLNQKKDDDIIVSAGPEFLLKPICNELGVKLIATKVDAKTGRIDGINNNDNEKLRRLRECGVVHIDSFYSDSASEVVIAEKADKAYFIKNGRITKWQIKK